MLQVYYLAAKEREHRFDQVFDQLDAITMFFPVTEVPSLVTLVARDKTIAQQNYIVCDLADAAWSDEHILSAVQMLRRFTSAQVIFLSPPSDRTTTLYRHLAELRVGGLIQDKDDPSGLLAAALRGDNGYVHRLSAIQQAVVATADKDVSPLRIPPGMVLDVAVCGAMPRIGTTTQAFGLYHYLAKLGFKPCVMDQGQETIQMLEHLYRDKCVVMDNYTEINGVRFARDRSSAFDAYITDYGTVTQDWIKPICAADLTVFVGGVKPWELPALAAAYTELLQEEPENLVTLLSFAAADDLDSIDRYIADYTAVAYHPDIWLPGNDVAYRAAVLPPLKRLCGEE